MKYLSLIFLLACSIFSYAQSVQNSGTRRGLLNTTSSFGTAALDNMIVMQAATEWVSAESEDAVRKEIAAFSKANNVQFELTKFMSGEPFDKTLLETYQIIVVEDDQNVIVAFRGTKDEYSIWNTLSNMFKDARSVVKEQLGFVNSSSINSEKYAELKVHRGFHKEYERFRQELLTFLDKKNSSVNRRDKTIYVTGHSLGSALATLCSFELAINYRRDVNAYYFGTPRVGDEEFRKAFNKEVPKCFRMVLNQDPVAKVPFRDSYEHVGGLLQLYKGGKQVPLDKIDAEIGSDWTTVKSDFQEHHARDAYKKALAAFKADRNTDGYTNLISLDEAARKERELSK